MQIRLSIGELVVNVGGNIWKRSIVKFDNDKPSSILEDFVIDPLFSIIDSTTSPTIKCTHIFHTYLSELIKKHGEDKVANSLFQGFDADKCKLGLGSAIIQLFTESKILHTTNTGLVAKGNSSDSDYGFASTYEFTEDKVNDLVMTHMKSTSAINYPMVCKPNVIKNIKQQPYMTDFYLRSSGHLRLVKAPWNNATQLTNLMLKSSFFTFAFFANTTFSWLWATFLIFTRTTISFTFSISFIS